MVAKNLPSPGETSEEIKQTKRNQRDVIAWHPDSDFGPTDQNHPMLNRTILSTS